MHKDETVQLSNRLSKFTPKKLLFPDGQQFGLFRSQTRPVSLPSGRRQKPGKRRLQRPGVRRQAQARLPG